MHIVEAIDKDEVKEKIKNHYKQKDSDYCVSYYTEILWADEVIK